MVIWTVSKIFERNGGWYFDGPTKHGDIAEYGPWKTQDEAQHWHDIAQVTFVAEHNAWVARNG